MLTRRALFERGVAVVLALVGLSRLTVAPRAARPAQKPAKPTWRVKLIRPGEYDPQYRTVATLPPFIEVPFERAHGREFDVFAMTNHINEDSHIAIYGYIRTRPYRAWDAGRDRGDW